jgi:hypothetical protein
MEGLGESPITKELGLSAVRGVYNSNTLYIMETTVINAFITNHKISFSPLFLTLTSHLLSSSRLK